MGGTRDRRKKASLGTADAESEKARRRVAERVRPRLVAVLGPTASGKTETARRIALALAPARALLVSVDARQVYRGLDVATAKEGARGTVTLPGLDALPARRLAGDVDQVLVDVADPSDRWTAARHAALASRVITAARAAGVTPLLVGGTALYAEALLRGFVFPASSAPEARGRGTRPPEPPVDALVLVPRVDDAELRRRIAARVSAWFGSGALADEVARWRGTLPERAEAWTGIGYAEAAAWLAGDIERDEAERRTIARSWQYARRQRSYVRNRFPEARAVTVAEAVTLARDFLLGGRE